ncbi:MerR family transcriptional regulator [Thalassobacillus sp. CUG 92003]|uniref:MerR family transcriptional regulator n=1 Tax=Thalassobacillus sp. CUG 92003 TaxID=2736641 RepID=UPI0015E79182
MEYFLTGEVSRKLNLSLRTLRYYDQIELVEPAWKSKNGTRYYTTEQLLQLQKVLILRSASLSLEDIKKILNRVTMEKTLTVHKEQLEHNMSELQQSLDYTHTLLNTLKLEGDIHWNQLLPLLSEETQSLKQQKKQAVMERLFNGEERTILEERLPKMEMSPSEVGKWINVIKRIELCLTEGKAPESPEGQLIAEDTQILSDETFNGDAVLAEKFWEARKSEEKSAELNLYPIDNDVVAFMEAAILQMEKERDGNER